MVGDNNLDSPGDATAPAIEATEQAPENTSEEKKKLLEEEKTDGTTRTSSTEVSATGTFEVIDVDEEIHLLD